MFFIFLGEFLGVRVWGFGIQTWFRDLFPLGGGRRVDHGLFLKGCVWFTQFSPKKKCTKVPGVFAVCRVHLEGCLGVGNPTNGIFGATPWCLPG